ncbi:CARDB domain-containing protein [Pyrococcus sp. ST04]|uniref:CARDB domain-containing protein n=1 Tax=Pyrococcus sp. ST04 TaxID=1183377 RepID=UPI0002605D4E|nr:CARDB domain-containing protein [Pyrococcus sp. ST04]AFK22471.1 hypothetical protein Py04_0879 [Pyrococcus sp. ST04]
MKRLMGVIILVLLVGSTLSVISANTFVVAQATEDPYNMFWEILSKEAELVVEANRTGNITIIKELIRNSQLGAENAANLSALIWISIEELKKTGVKLYYTEAELKEMANEIKENGLPEETKSVLREQGWNEEEIKSLEDYIVRHSDDIKGDFNMTEFLEDLSLAFVEVGYKYNKYEAWALKRARWTNSLTPPSLSGDTKMINPLFYDIWLQLYREYNSQNFDNAETLIKKLKRATYLLLFEKRVETPSGEYVLISPTYKLISLNWTKDEGVVFTVIKIGSGVGIRETYYWPNALKAYELMGNVYTLVKSINLGNTNPTLRRMLNQKMAELGDALNVYVIYREIIKRPIYYISISSPIRNNIGSVPLDRRAQRTSSEPDEIEKVASGEYSIGKLVIKDVQVLTKKIDNGRISYNVKIVLVAESNIVKNIRVEIKDSSGDKDEKYIDIIYPQDGETSIVSKEFTLNIPDNSKKIRISGNVMVTYTPGCGNLPTSIKDLAACQDRTTTREYSEIIDISRDPEIEYDKVKFEVVPSPSTVEEGKTVLFKIKVKNDNSQGFTARYSLNIRLPEGEKSCSGEIFIPGNGEFEKGTCKINYSKPGTYGYLGELSYKNYIWDYKGYITVIRESPKGTIRINSILWEPEVPKVNRQVNFKVEVKNEYDTSKTLLVKLFIDGKEIDSAQKVVSGNSAEEFSLTWVPSTSGEHDVLVKVYEVIGNQKLQRAERRDTVAVVSGREGFLPKLEAFPQELEGGGEVTFLVEVWNYNSDRINLKGFCER